MAIEEDLKDCREVSFQAALLYTSSKVRTALVTARDLHPDLRYDEQGERRIRVHTLCVPTTASLQEVIQSADQQCIVGLLAKMAVDRTLNTNLADAREAFINVCVDTIERWAGLSIQHPVYVVSMTTPCSGGRCCSVSASRGCCRAQQRLNCFLFWFWRF